MILNGDAGRIPLRDGEIHCVVTSPPYWSLRKYAGEQERDWGEVRYSPVAGLGEVVVGEMRCALGLEGTVEAYIGHLVAVFREVRRVLRADGVAWVVMGDSYASTAQGTENAPQPKGSKSKSSQWANFCRFDSRYKVQHQSWFLQ